jgi:cellulose synthase operon protein C
VGLAALPARADNPIDAANERLAAGVSRHGREPAGALELLELWGHYDDSAPGKLRSALERLAADARLAPALRVAVRSMLAEARARSGDVEALEQPYRELGYVTDWRVIGPFDNEGKAGFAEESPPEKMREDAPDLQASYPGRERPVSWREYPEISRRGYVSLGSIMRPRENVCGLAETFVYAERARPLSLWIGSGGANKVYWNGREVFRDAAYRAPNPDRGAAMVYARAGQNRLLVKVCIASGNFGFHLRLGEADGGVAKGLRVSSMYQGAWAPAEKRTDPAPGRTPLAPLAGFEQAAGRKPENATALAALAKFMGMTGADDPAERRAQQLAVRAAELAPTLPHLELAALASEQRGEQLRFADRAAALFPNQPESLLLRAEVISGGPSPEDALPLLARIGQDNESSVDARLLEASVLRELDLPGAALRKVEQTVKRVGETPRLLRRLTELQAATNAQDAALVTRKRLLQQRADDTASRRVLVNDALARGQTAQVLEHADVLLKLTPGSPDNLLQVAALYDALGRDDLVLSMHRRAMEIAPESAEIQLAYGKALLRAERPELAADAFARALSLKPQDTTAREMLEQIKHGPREDEAYAMPSAAILEKRPKRNNGYPVSVLMDLTVNTVFENGLGSSFRQYAVAVQDQEGARQFRTFPIHYDPDSQRVDLRLARVYRKDGRELESVRTFEQQLGEPWYRIYYDTRALVVVFADIEPGDVVEIRYRVDDIAHRNLFADYYGDTHVWQGMAPVARSEYVLITPAARQFYLSDPKLPALRHTQQVVGERRIDHWLAENVPAIVGENGMPGLTELSPYLHVSTYQSWQAVGRWYWGLIRDQLYADESLKRTVRELTHDTKDARTKVRRIYDWVVTHTRYVGLEFGIHGFMPYRVPLVVQRGFGDCKDKASLLYTMLREANIDARIVLLRTRRNGEIGAVPASLAVFDHAITYVPAFDLYLDGTAEHSGTEELPVQDQGVMVLRVGPDGAELTKTPVLTAERNSQRTRNLRIQLAADGSARIEGNEQVAGAEAAGYRDHYQAKGTRAERLERRLGEIYPGVSLETQQFASLSDREQPVRYGYTMKVPQLAQWNGDELQLRASVLRDLTPDMARLQQRRRVLDLQGTRHYTEERSVKLAPGLDVSELPEGGEVSSPFGRLKLDFSRQGNTLKTRTEFTVAQDRIEPSEYPEFRRWVQAADQLLKQQIAIRKDGPARTTASAGDHAP